MSQKSGDWTGQSISDGRYRIKAKLGEGGMGVVYRALDTRLGTDVVIKVPRAAMLDDPEFAGRFAREIQSLVKLSHPGIVKVTDVGKFEGLPFAVMQFLPGGSLEDRQRDASGRFALVDPKGIPAWLSGIASALDYIHSQGYVHRDVKPANILFDAQGHAFLGDFGVIKALESSERARTRTAATGAGLVLGTPEYMAPESIMGSQVDGRADQYALAVTVYEILAGQRPFEGASPTAVLVLHTTRVPPALTGLRPGLPEPLWRAVLKGMAKDPAGRYPNCAALASAVIATLQDYSPVAGSAAHASSGGVTAESVKIACSTCGKKIAMAASTFAALRRTGRTFPCPGCQTEIQVANPATQILGAPAPSGATPAATQKLGTPEPGLTPSGTQKLATSGLAPGAGVSPSGTQKLETSGLSETYEFDRSASEPARATTQKLPTPGLTGNDAPVRARTQIQARPKASTTAAAQTKPSLLPWIGAGVAALVLLAVCAIAFIPRGAAQAPAADPENIALKPFTAPRGEPRRPAAAAKAQPEALSVADALAIGTSKDSISPSSNPGSGSGGGGEAPAVAAATAMPAGPSPDSPSASIASAATPDKIGATAIPAGPAAAPEETPLSLPTSLAGAGKPGTEKTKEKKGEPPTLEEILAGPERYADQELSPRGLFRLSKIVYHDRMGTPQLAVMQSGMTISRKNYSAVPIDGGKTATLEVDRDIANKLIINGLCLRGMPLSSSAAAWEKHVAILTLRVLKATAMSPGAAWVCRIVKAEFLINLDAQRIGEHRFARAFQTYTISEGGEGIGVGDGEEWQKRLGLHFIADTGKVARYIKTQLSIAKNAANTAAVVGAVNRGIAATQAANAAAAAATSAAMGPRQVVNGRAVFNQEVNLNVDLVR